MMFCPHCSSGGSYEVKESNRLRVCSGCRALLEEKNNRLIVKNSDAVEIYPEFSLYEYDEFKPLGSAPIITVEKEQLTEVLKEVMPMQEFNQETFFQMLEEMTPEEIAETEKRAKEMLLDLFGNEENLKAYAQNLEDTLGIKNPFK